MKVGLTTVSDNAANLRATIAALAKRQVLVGVPASTAGRSDGPIDNATLGYIHEFGSPAANIPARPFLHPGVASVGAKIAARLRVAAKLALDGKKSNLDRALTAVGLLAQNAVRAKITAGPFEPLSPRTRRKRERKLKGEKLTASLADRRPLIDTGALRRAITYVIRDRKR